MSFISKLKFSDAKRTSAPSATDPKARLRQKLIAAIDTQIGYLKADIEGKTIDVKVKKYRGIGDDRKQVEESKRIRRWYFQADGEWHTEVRYGTSAIMFGKHSVIAGGETLEGLLEVYDIIKNGVDKGELDKELAVAGVRKRRSGNESSTTADPEPEATVAPRFKAARKPAIRK